jgi:hypothetical protein
MQNNISAAHEFRSPEGDARSTFVGANGPDWEKSHCATQESHRKSRAGGEHDGQWASSR